jgi:hypothetical protein
MLSKKLQQIINTVSKVAKKPDINLPADFLNKEASKAPTVEPTTGKKKSFESLIKDFVDD